jgi:hypothetical protein
VLEQNRWLLSAVKRLESRQASRVRGQDGVSSREKSRAGGDDVQSLTIFGKPYQVKYVDKINDGDQFGELDTGTGLISVLNTSTKQMQEETLLHEIIHAIDEDMGIGLNEKQVQRLSVSLYAVLKENNFQRTGKLGGTY